MADVTLRDVRKSFGGLEIIHGVDLDIKDNEFTVFVGPSGCGKSTLLRLIAGLEDITSGEMTIDGVRVNDLPPKERGISMVFQSYALYPHMTVYDNMAFGLKLANSGKDAIDAKVREAARILQIENLLTRKPRELSGGQRQRVAIGRAIVREPKVFLFDEPLSNLDAALRVQMRIELAKLKEDLNATMVYVTHDQVEAMTLANKIVVLRAGHVEQVGSPLELYHHPRNLFVAGFIGSPKMNFIETAATGIDRDSATVQLPGGGTLTVPARSAGLAPGAPVTLGVRPEHLVAGDPGSGGGDAVMDGKVFVVERLGGETYCHVRTADGQSIVLRTGGEDTVRPGEQIRIGIPAGACHLFDRDGIALDRLERHPMADQEMPRHAHA
ncbi:sn-glycerol-3-phosphate ABC transporter ATP-binding protein UgpC [Skermanella sp. TT6]|uniref:Sn-glycerol-3-phosphate ABC transporter ATP-binding protein UgpC n=1 Tax=Skermanella cutis TaxID=2775420 RepID=A0ABX7BFG2_9PROT|nr:sn-glycerol-3-phosphate ABC transporter ATP-binding protein UgpC [Skermanella sp. TT6]QQP91172.1 sn-glycerol-3-phosphate ABC transporter ATP-binding protein UgpC [Skermanella sp. TT6]